MALLTPRRALRPAPCALMTAAVLLWAATLWAHHGRTLVLVHQPGPLHSLAANLVAAYVGEQMGRSVKAQEKDTAEECLGAILDREAPMGLVIETDWNPREGLALVGPPFTAASVTYRLVMGTDISSDLSFSLVPDYLTRLGSVLVGMDLSGDIEKVRGGKGARGLAERILREADLL